MDGRSINTTLEHTLMIIEPAHGRDHQVAPHLNAQCTRLLIPGDGRAIATPMLSDCVVVLSHVTGMYLRPAQWAEERTRCADTVVGAFLWKNYCTPPEKKPSLSPGCDIGSCRSKTARVLVTVLYRPLSGCLEPH